MRVSFYNPKKYTTFWSRKWTVSPEDNEFELPFGWTFGTCTILVRMGKDFGDDVLPIPFYGKYEKTSTYPAEAYCIWDDILWSLDYLLGDFILSKMPGWAPGLGMGARYIVAVYVPNKSPMARRWTDGMRSRRFLGGEWLTSDGNNVTFA
ncbi:MAG: hypothetical protein Q9186_003617 [Xanthomendoza sp. 1 TL-2023]